MRSLPTLVVLGMTVPAAISGCVAIPIPASKSKPAIVGRKVEAKDLEGIIPLETSRDDLIARLGEPGIELVGLRILAYPWTALRRTWLILGMGVGAFEESQRAVVFVALDENNRVIKVGIDHPSGSDASSMLTWARRWADVNGVKVAQAKVGYVPAAMRNGEGLINIYRARPAAASLGFFTRARFPEAVGIAIDGRYVAELLDGEYVSVAVPAGVHAITIHPAPPYRARAKSADDRSSPAVHPSGATIGVRDGERCFLETVATVAKGLSYDTSIRSLPEDEATPVMSGAHSVW